MRNFIRGFAPKAAITALAAAMLCAVLPSEAQASVLVTVWNADTNSGSIADPTQQALPTNPLASGTPIATFTYNGLVNWFSAGASDNFLDDFVGFGGGTITGCVGTGCASATTLGHVELSSAPFDITSLFRIAFSVSGPVSGNIDHDDGVSIYDATDTTSFYDASAPTVEVPLAVSLGAGTYHLWYVEANGAPSVLDVERTIITRTGIDDVPEPATLALIAVCLLSLLGLGITRRRTAG